MVKHNQTIHRLLPTNCLSVFDHFVGLALKGLNNSKVNIVNHEYLTKRGLINSLAKYFISVPPQNAMEHWAKTC